MAHKVTLIRGDGTGPELAEATRRVLDATGVKIEWDVQEAGVDVMKTAGTPLPEATLESLRRTGLGLKAPITTPVGTGFRSVNVALRHIFDLYACLRPCKSYAGVRSRYREIDLVIVRENTEDCYAGIEFERGTPACDEIVRTITKLEPKAAGKIKARAGITIKPISEEGTRRVVKFAFEYARKYKRRKVTSVHKANIMKHTDGLWLEVSREVAKGYSDIEFEDRIVDNMCMQLVQKPELYDVLVLPNLYGDILSDLCAGLVGGLGVVPGSNLGERCAVFEAVHGSAPDIAGKRLANPAAMMLSAAELLRHIGERDGAARLEAAVHAALADPKSRTRDLGGKADLDGFTAAVVERLG